MTQPHHEPGALGDPERFFMAAAYEAERNESQAITSDERASAADMRGESTLAEPHRADARSFRERSAEFRQRAGVMARDGREP